MRDRCSSRRRASSRVLVPLASAALWLLAAATRPCAAQGSGPETDAAGSAPGALAQQIAAILAEPAVARAHWGISVKTMDGATIFSRNEAQLFQPASTAKLFTTAAAMALLGPESTVETRITGQGSSTDASELHGDLVLVGAADANLSGRVLPYVAPSRRPRSADADAKSPAPDPLAPLLAMADAVAATGLKLVTGDVVGDDRLFPSEPYAIGWEQDDLVWGYGAPASALSVADNQLRLTVTPGERAGQPAAVVLDQVAPFYVVEAAVTTAPARSASGGVQIERAPGSRALRVYGQIAADAGADVEEIAIADPAEYAALALKAMLEARGVVVRGSAVALHRYPVEARGFLSQLREPLASLVPPAPVQRSAPAATSGCAHCAVKSGTSEKLLARYASPPLAQDIVATNKTSQNLHAELLLRRLGLAWGADGSAAQGARVVRQFLLSAGIDRDDVILYDGSGLSDHDLVTPRAQAELLAYAARQPWFATWKASLPVGGVDGTLSSRFIHDPLQGRVFAKTGTLGEARALAGYLQCASGRTVLFSIMDTAHPPGSNADRDAMDRIVAAVAAAN